MAGLFFCLASQLMQGFSFFVLFLIPSQSLSQRLFSSIASYTHNKLKAFTGLYRPISCDIAYYPPTKSNVHIMHTASHPEQLHRPEDLVADTRYTAAPTQIQTFTASNGGGVMPAGSNCHARRCTPIYTHFQPRTACAALASAVLDFLLLPVHPGSFCPAELVDLRLMLVDSLFRSSRFSSLSARVWNSRNQ